MRANDVRETEFEDGRLSRRNVLAGAGLAGLAATLAAAQASAEEDHSKHAGSHSGHAGTKHKDLVKSALACVAEGEACAAHCIAMLSSGDTSLKDCFISVQTMMPACAALARLGALEAARLKEFAAICVKICDDCEKECRKHEDKHELCKACAESCARCIKDCKAVIGA